MKTICDVCESAPAILFCAADEAALCRSCDDKVHKCNKLASRHVRVGLAVPSEVPRCDICENAPAFFYCEIDGSSLCLQCDMIVHVGGKRTHSRYLLLRQRVEFLGDKPIDQVNDKKEDQLPRSTLKERLHGNQNSISQSQHNAYDHVNMDSKMIDLNTRPLRMQGQPSSTRDAQVATGNSHEDGVVPLGSLKGQQ